MLDREPFSETVRAGMPVTLRAIEALRMSRSRDRILANLDEMYSEAFERAKTSGDDTQWRHSTLRIGGSNLNFEILLEFATPWSDG